MSTAPGGITKIIKSGAKHEYKYLPFVKHISNFYIFTYHKKGKFQALNNNFYLSLAPFEKLSYICDKLIMKGY